MRRIRVDVSLIDLCCCDGMSVWLAGLKHTKIKTNLIPRVEDNRPNSARDVVERCCVAVAENGREELDREVANRDI